MDRRNENRTEEAATDPTHSSSASIAANTFIECFAPLGRGTRFIRVKKSDLSIRKKHMRHQELTKRKHRVLYFSMRYERVDRRS